MGLMTGRCHCGAVAYQIKQIERCGLCHCTDCRRWSGAPMVGWVAAKEEDVTIVGKTQAYASSPNAKREFCAACGTGLFYRNPVVLPGIIDIQSGTLDHPESVPPEGEIMVKEKLPWMNHLNELPQFWTYPGMDDEKKE